MNNQHEAFMQRAIELSKYACFTEKSGGAFGAVIVKDGKIIGEGYNQVLKYKDPTCHAEMQAIRAACKTIGAPHLEGCILYTSAECCPMCLGACYWAHIAKIYYASHYEDVLKYGNFQDANILEELKKPTENRQILATELLRSEALEVWKAFSQMPDRAHY